MDLNTAKLLLNTIIEQYNGDKLDIKKYVDELLNDKLLNDKLVNNKYEYINKDILSTDKKNYILKHPAKSNKRCCEYRLSHTSNPITKIVKINYNDLKYIINNWEPDDEIGVPPNLVVFFFSCSTGPLFVTFSLRDGLEASFSKRKALLSALFIAFGILFYVD